MKRFTSLIMLAVTATCLSCIVPGDVSAADVPKDRVVVMYFHRTERCPTCKKMGSYSDDAVKAAFKEQLKKGTVSFHFIDFQDKKNEKLAKGYRIEDPALVVAKIADNKVAKFTNLEDIWTKVGDKPAFMKYVQNAVTTHQK